MTVRKRFTDIGNVVHTSFRNFFEKIIFLKIENVHTQIVQTLNYILKTP